MNEMEADLLGYLLKANDPALDRRLQEEILSDNTLAQKANRILHLLEPLEADKKPIEPPADLAVKTIGFVAEHMAREKLSADEQASPQKRKDSAKQRMDKSLPVSVIFPSQEAGASSSLQRRNWFAGIGLAVAVLLILFPAVAAMRAQYRIQACQNNLRELHGSLIHYAETHNGQFPLMEPDNPESQVLKQLQAAAVLYPSNKLSCVSDNGKFDYAYALGFLENGSVLALRQDDNERLPILADACERGADASNHHKFGQNVLFIDGSVLFCNSPNVGIQQDHIYYNKDWQVKPGLNRFDSVLASVDEMTP